MMRVFALLDDRAGNNAQVLGVAEKLGLPFEKIELRYNALAKLPNILLGATLSHIVKESRQALNRIIGSSDHRILVISAGRREAPVARRIKRRHPDALLCHMMLPGAGLREFDVPAVPQHDIQTGHGLGNVPLLLTPLSPHGITPEKLAQARAQWEPRFAALPRPRIGVLVGGSSKHAAMTQSEYALLARQVKEAAGQMQASLLVTTSRRTDAEGVKILQETLSDHRIIGSSEPLFFYRYGDAGENPYRGILACADYLIVTMDSISMCSEAAAAHKPLYLFSPAALTPKFERFKRTLCERNAARPFALPLDANWRPHPVEDAAEQIAARLRALLH
jgi:mitochondrial fission protein ELM1